MRTILVLLLSANQLSGCNKEDGGGTSDKNETATTEEEKKEDPPPPTTTGALALDLSGAVALANASVAGSAGLQRLNVDSTLSPAFTGAGTVAVGGSNLTEAQQPKVEHFFIAPNGTVYLSFVVPVALGLGLTEETTCTFASAAADGALTCLEASMKINWDLIDAPVQFDDASKIYYAGVEGTKKVLRQRAGEEKKDLINENLTLNQFVVDGNGSVALGGRTGEEKWIREISTAGSLSTLTDKADHFLKLPDDNLYFLDTEGGTFFVTPDFVPASDDGGEEGGGDDGGAGLHLAPQEGAAIDLGPLLTFAMAPTFSKTTLKTADGRTFIYTNHTTTQGENDSSIVQLYPGTPVRIKMKEIFSVSTMIAAGNKLVYAGKDPANKHRLVLIDPSTEVKTELVSEDVEVYHLSYSTKESKLYFDGLRFSDNTVVVGEVDLGSGGAATLTPAGSVKFSDFQSF